LTKNLHNRLLHEEPFYFFICFFLSGQFDFNTKLCSRVVVSTRITDSRGILERYAFAIGLSAYLEGDQ
jgi:hypothetical protein